jgi:hypothetical protein
MKTIYTLVLDPINGPLRVLTYVDPEVAKKDLLILCEQFPSYHVAEVPGLYFSVNLSERGGKGYIKETELIGDNRIHEQSLIKLARDIAKGSPDLKKGNYNDNEVLQLNGAMDEIFLMLDELIGGDHERS